MSKEKDNTELYIVAITAIVGIVAMIIFTTPGTGSADPVEVDQKPSKAMIENVAGQAGVTCPQGHLDNWDYIGDKEGIYWVQDCGSGRAYICRYMFSEGYKGEESCNLIEY